MIQFIRNLRQCTVEELRALLFGLVTILFILAIGALAPLAMAQDFRTAQVSQVSKSGRTFALDRGSFHGIETEMRAEFLWVAPGEDRLIRLGRAEALNVTPDRSYWLFESVRQDIVLETPAKVEFALTSSLRAGVRPFRIQQNKIILNEGVHPLEHFKDRQSHSPEDLVVRDEEYEEGEKVVETKVLRDDDMTVHEFDVWYESRSLQYVPEYRQELSSKHPRSGDKRHDISDVEQKFYDDAYDRIVEAYINHNQIVRDDREAFFYDLRPDEHYPQIRKTLTIDNVFDSYQRKKREEAKVSPLAQMRIERDGPLWSADMNRQELRNYFVQSGIEQEKRRQEKALRRHDSNEVTFEFATGLNKTANPDDPDFQGTNYSVGLSYEFHLGRTVEKLDNWGVLFGVERSVAFYDIGGFNAVYSEGHMMLGINYYLYNTPNVVRDYIGYIGAGFKLGAGDFRSAQLIEDHEIQSIRYPVYAGVKYRFSAGDERGNRLGLGWGVNVRLSYEVGEKNILGFSDEEFERSINPGVMAIHLGLSTYF